MTHICCPACRLRLPPAAASGFAACPICRGDLLEASAVEVVGFPLFAPAHVAMAPADVAMVVASAESPNPPRL